MTTYNNRESRIQKKQNNQLSKAQRNVVSDDIYNKHRFTRNNQKREKRMEESSNRKANTQTYTKLQLFIFVLNVLICFV